MTELHPPAEPHDTGRLGTEDGQKLYWEVVGVPDGLPAVYLHGGPGSGSSERARRLFDPGRYRAVLFDQRGCGRSSPSAADPTLSLATNTTEHQLADIERLRHHLGIDAWVVVGTSWGVTLALAYAQRHPDRVRGMVLLAVTTGTRREIDWITRGVAPIFPREWERFVRTLPEEAREGDLSAGYASMLADPDPHVRAIAAREWCRWEDTHVSLMPDWHPDPRFQDPEFRYVFARLVTHYWSNGSFLTGDAAIERHVNQLEGIPATMVHGRYDVSSPLVTAWELHHAWPGSHLVVLGDAGHGGDGLAAAGTRALDAMVQRLG